MTSESGPAIAGPESRLGAAPVRLADDDLDVLPIGSVIPDFTGLLGTDGRRHDLAEFSDRPFLALIFTSNRCPTAKAYAGRIRALQDAYGPNGLQIVLINSNDPYLYPEESLPRMVERVVEDGLAAPYLVDEGQRLARAFGPQRTFHVFLVDPDRRLRYEGRFDDARLPERVTTSDLANALDDLLAGRSVRTPRTRAFGCSLDLV